MVEMGIELNKKSQQLNPMAEEFRPQTRITVSHIQPQTLPFLIWHPNRRFYSPLKPTHIFADGKNTKTMMIPKKKKKTQVLPPPFSSFGKNTTTLMIRNLPVRLGRGELMELLDEHCREENGKQFTAPPSEFDFLYLPIDFKRKGNKGYAFVNFTSWEGADRLFKSWEGTNWLSTGHSTSKICRFSAALLQGKEALNNKFSESVFRCENEEFLPVVITPPRNGSNARVTTLIPLGTRLRFGY